MTYDITRLTQSLSDPTEEQHQQQQRMPVDDKHFPYDERRHSIAGSDQLRLRRSISRTSSYDSLDQDDTLPEYFGSQELDQLSSCLSEVSSDSNKESSTTLTYDIIQAQLALWTFVWSFLYSYAWGQHRKKFLLCIFFLVPTVFISCCLMSCLLTTVVILGRFFSTPLSYTFKDFLAYDQPSENEEPDVGRRQRSYSGTSSVSLDSGDPLPKPLCRRHSSSHTSLCSRPPSVNRKLSYCYSHYNSTDG